MMTIEQIKRLDKQSSQEKLLPTTVEFLKEMRLISNAGRERNGLKPIIWTENDEARY